VKIVYCARLILSQPDTKIPQRTKFDIEKSGRRDSVELERNIRRLKIGN
jgi:hypothetical protein